jgi:hypothetical protein
MSANSFISDPEITALFASDPELLALADAVVATQAHQKRESLRPLRLPPSLRGRLVLAACVLLAAVVVPTALAFRGQIVDLIEGPAPPSVIRNFTEANRAAAQHALQDQQQRGVSAPVHPIEVAQTHGVVALDTIDGRVDLWAAPEQGGGQCWNLQIKIQAAAPDPGYRSAGSCDSNVDYANAKAYPNFPNPIVTWPVTFTERPNVWLVLVRVYNAASIQLQHSDGTEDTLPVIDGFALAALPNTEKTATIVAKDASGATIASTLVDPSHSVGVG